MSLATTIQESISKRRGHVRDALYYRRHGMKIAKRAALDRAACEKLNLKYFIGPCPF